MLLVGRVILLAGLLYSVTSADIDDARATWRSALSMCDQMGGDMVSFPPNVADYNWSEVAAAKREFHVGITKDVWTGNFITYQIHETTAHSGVDYRNYLCVTVSFIDIVRVHGNQFKYRYILRVHNCTAALTPLCTGVSGELTTTSIASNRSSVISACTLWVPNYTLVTHPSNGVFASGEWISVHNTPSVFGKKFWVNMYIETHMVVYPDKGNALVCGYLSATAHQSVLYVDCFEQKGIACRTSNGTGELSTTTQSWIHPGSTNNPFSSPEQKTTPEAYLTSNGQPTPPFKLGSTTSRQKSTVSTQGSSSYDDTRLNENQFSGGIGSGGYAGIAVGVVIILSSVIGVVCWLKIRRTRLSDVMGQKLPAGGHSFSRPKLDRQISEEPMSSSNNRITTYAKIDPREVREMNVFNANDMNIDMCADDPGYDSIGMHARDVGTPDVVPKSRNHQEAPPVFPERGYMMMDSTGTGSCQEQQTTDEHNYDTLSHDQSTSCKHVTGGVNVYGYVRDSESDSTYNQTFDRQSSRKALVDPYDHVQIHTSTSMERAFCDSISADSTAVNVNNMFVQNPTYDKIE